MCGDVELDRYVGWGARYDVTVGYLVVQGTGNAPARCYLHPDQSSPSSSVYLSVTRGCSHIGRPSRILSLGRELRPMSVPERTGVALVELSVDPCAVVSFEILEEVKTEGGDGNGWRRGLVYD